MLAIQREAPAPAVFQGFYWGFIRALRARRAVEGDDWSAVIAGQTEATLPEDRRNGEASTSGQLPPAHPQHPAATPFARASVHRSIGAHACAAMRLAPLRVIGPACRAAGHPVAGPLGLSIQEALTASLARQDI
jgi:hypothetical protein